MSQAAYRPVQQPRKMSIQAHQTLLIDPQRREQSAATAGAAPVRLSPNGNPISRPRGTYKRRDENCLCGNPATKLKCSVPVCDRCDRLESQGFVGGSYMRAQNH